MFSIFPSSTGLFNVSCLSLKAISELKDVAIQNNCIVTVCGPARSQKALDKPQDFSLMSIKLEKKNLFNIVL